MPEIEVTTGPESEQAALDAMSVQTAAPAPFNVLPSSIPVTAKWLWWYVRSVSSLLTKLITGVRNAAPKAPLVLKTEDEQRDSTVEAVDLELVLSDVPAGIYLLKLFLYFRWTAINPGFIAHIQAEGAMVPSVNYPSFMHTYTELDSVYGSVTYDEVLAANGVPFLSVRVEGVLVVPGSGTGSLSVFWASQYDVESAGEGPTLKAGSYLTLVPLEAL